MSYDQKDISMTEDKSRTRKLIDTLSHGFKQSVETVTRQARFEISGTGVDQIDAPQELDEYATYARNTAIIRKSMRKFVDDVWEPGYRVEGPDETVAYFMGEFEAEEGGTTITPPPDTPEGGFLKNSGVYAGETHQDFYDIGKEASWQRWIRGTVLVELLKEDEDNPDSEISGFYFVRPETISAEVYPNTNILIDPEDTDVSGIELTKRGEAASYIQFDDQSILGRRGNFSDDEEIPLSQNDVHKQVLEPDIGDDPGMQQGVFGTSIIEAIADEIAEYKQIKRDRAAAIQTKAYGIWAMEYDRQVLDLGNGQKEIIEWDTDDMDDDGEEIGNLEPGQIAQYDGAKNLKKFESEVPDLVPTLNQYVDEILAPLPTPKYKVGFGDNINRDVTSEQGEDYDRTVDEEREYQERQWTQVLRTIAERKGLPTEGLRLKIKPKESDNPIERLTMDEIQKFQAYAEGLNSISGGSPASIVDLETLLVDVAQLPESVLDPDSLELEQMEDEEQDAMAEFQSVMGIDTLANSFSEGDEVDTPSGVGVVVEIRTEDFDGPSGESVEASEDNPAYVVGVESGAEVYRESELSEGSIEVDVDDPESDLDAMADIADAGEFEILADDGRTFDYPESWKESSTPNRIILLKAWAGLGGRFTTCRRKMAGKISSPNRFCASMKDAVLQWEGWRQ